MKKQLVLGCLATATFGVALLSGTQASAENAAPVVKTNRNMTTDGSIVFYNDNKPDEGPFAGNLAFAYVPGEFNFGTHSLNGLSGSKTYDQARRVGAGKQYIAVSDDRPDTKTQWQVAAQLDDFETNGGTKLGADSNVVLDFTLGVPEKYNINIKDSDNAKTALPVITEPGSLATWDYKGLVNGGVVKPVTLTAGDTTGVSDVLQYMPNATTPDTTTVGAAAEVTDVKLTVKKHNGVEATRYTSTLNWSLSTTPTDGL